VPYIGNTNTTQAFTPAVDFFNGNGSTTAFTLSRPVAAVAQVQAVIENVPQNPGDAFTVSGNTITFTSAPPSGTSNIYVYYTSPITQVIAPSQGTVGTSALVDGAVTTAKIADNAITTAKIAAGAVVQADLATGVAGTGPAFSAYKSTNQTISHNTITKVTFDTESYDTNNNFASSTFTPTVAGYYQVCSVLDINGTFNRSYLLNSRIYKNGAAVKDTLMSFVFGNGSESGILNTPPPIYMNGSTDYLELYVYVYDYTASGSVTVTGTTLYTTFGAYLVRAA